MKKWKDKVKIDNQIFTVVEHTDKECEKPRKDEKFLAPKSNGFVCLYIGKTYEQWCGVNFARENIYNENRI